VTCAIKPGCATITPPGAEMVYDLGGTRSHTYAHFTVSDTAAVVAAPVLVDLGKRYAGLEAALQEASGWTSRQAGRASARLWDVLWSVVSAGTAGSDESLVDRARDLIEARLGARLPVALIARELGCSHGHLVRSFRATLGTTVVGWILGRRVQRAAHLLRNSSLPMAEIARSVGAYDLHAFNKLVRRGLGRPPRQVRAGR
jgi:AraC family transcriptional regulator